MNKININSEILFPPPNNDLNEIDISFRQISNNSNFRLDKENYNFKSLNTKKNFTKYDEYISFSEYFEEENDIKYPEIKYNDIEENKIPKNNELINQTNIPNLENINNFMESFQIEDYQREYMFNGCELINQYKSNKNFENESELTNQNSSNLNKYTNKKRTKFTKKIKFLIKIKKNHKKSKSHQNKHIESPKIMKDFMEKYLHKRFKYKCEHPGCDKTFKTLKLKLNRHDIDESCCKSDTITLLYVIEKMKEIISSKDNLNESRMNNLYKKCIYNIPHRIYAINIAGKSFN